jgi:hypothetical protein
MNPQDFYLATCNRTQNILSQLSGKEKYLYAHALQGVTTAILEAAADLPSAHFSKKFQQILEETTDIVNEYEGDNPSEELHLKPKEKLD